MNGNTLADSTIDRLFVAKQITVPAASFGDSHIQPAAGIQASKLQQQRCSRIETESATTVASFRRPIHLQQGVGALVLFRAFLIDANAGAATVTVDLLKNGVTVLDAPITLDNSIADRVPVDAVFDTPIAALAADDVFEVDVVATAGGGTLGKGLGIYFYTTDEPAA